MSVREFSQATEILALLERGDLAADLSVEIRKVISDLQERAGQKGKASGHVTLRLDMTIEDGVKLEVRGKIETKTPPIPRRASWLFATPNGTVSVEHPSQRDMFTRDVTGERKEA